MRLERSTKLVEERYVNHDLLDSAVNITILSCSRHSIVGWFVGIVDKYIGAHGISNSSQRATADGNDEVRQKEDIIKKELFQ